MIIADAGLWIALANKKDKHHTVANSTVKGLNERLITTNPVITEVCHILLKRQGIQAQLGFMTMYKLSGFEVFELQSQHKSRVVALMQQYADLPMDFADASMVILAEHLGHGRILSTDRRDFNTYRWKNSKPFQNLLLD